MEKLKLMQTIKDIYEKDQNIMEYLKNIENSECNSVEDIMISYDFQAGKYIEYYYKDKVFADKYCKTLANVLQELGEFKTLLEVGVGEATTLGPVVLSMKNEKLSYYGFDISWSRVKYAKCFLESLNLSSENLFVGDLFNIPIKDNAIDIVYTSHSIEPNGGKEKEALEELYRITNKYLVLLEPAYEFATEEARARMNKHGYVTALYQTAKELGYNVIEYKLFELSSNPLNPTGLMIIEKSGHESRQGVDKPLCCPITKTSIENVNGSYYSKESMIVFPIIDRIPCLLSQNGTLATKFLEEIDLSNAIE